MKRLITLLTIFGSMLVSSQMAMAKQVTVYYFAPSDWAGKTVKAWVWQEKVANYCANQNWPGDECEETKTVAGTKVWKWTGNIPDDVLANNKALIIFNDGINHGNISDADKIEKTQTSNLEFVDGAYYNIKGKTSMDVPAKRFKMIAISGTGNDAKKLELYLSPARTRSSGPVDESLYSIGFKDDLLPVTKDNKWHIYIEDTKTGNQYRPWNNNNGYANCGGNMGQLLDLKLPDINNLKYYGNVQYADPTAKGTNTFEITKGDGVSYTFALNLGGQITQGGDENRNSFFYQEHSVSLYVNSSIYEMYSKSSKYKNTYKGVDEDYYLIGSINNIEYKTDANNKMVRKVFYNPITNAVDSIVYSSIVSAPEGFGSLFLSFVPKCVMDDGSKFWGYTGTNGARSKEEKFNYVIRPELFDDRDATALFGSVFVRGVDEYYKYQNGNQALNPAVDAEGTNKYKYYIVRLNVTTSTYRIEFVDDEYLAMKDLCTFSSQANLRLPEDGKLKAYAVHSYTTIDKKNPGYDNKNAQGTVELRSLSYIPANEGVVLVDKGTVRNADGKIKLTIITDAENDSPVVEDLKDAWVKKNDYTDEYNNYLVPVVFGDNITIGDYEFVNGDKYHYLTRNFALCNYKSTTEGKKEENKDVPDYNGFFRYEGKIAPKKAYLQLPASVMDYDGQAMNATKDEDAQALSKVLFSFDDINNGGTTGINEVKTNAQKQDGAYYNLQGVKVAHPVKGLYIHNGKKVVF